MRILAYYRVYVLDPALSYQINKKRCYDKVVII